MWKFESSQEDESRTHAATSQKLTENLVLLIVTQCFIKFHFFNCSNLPNGLHGLLRVVLHSSQSKKDVWLISKCNLLWF